MIGSLANVTIRYLHNNYHDENGDQNNRNASVAKPPMNKPLTAAGEKELLVVLDCMWGTSTTTTLESVVFK